MKPWLELELQAPLDNFQLALKGTCQARVTGVFGPSGAGKTTLLEAIAGVRRDVTGRLAHQGESWLDSARGHFLRPEQRGIGYVPQDHRLFPHWTVEQNLRAGERRARQQAPTTREATWHQIVATLELGPLLGRSPRHLSGGERQRVSLGRALYSAPKLLLLDEPLASLDAALRQRILPYLQRVRDVFAVPMLVVSHQPTELLALCDEVWAMEAGQFVAQGPPLEVLTARRVYAQAAAQDGFQNLLTGVVEARDAEHGLLRLTGGPRPPTLILLPGPYARAERLTVRLAAHDILLAPHAVPGLSARNQLPVRITELRALPDKVIVLVAVVGAEATIIAVELTPLAVADLHLTEGHEVFMIVKASALQAY